MVYDVPGTVGIDETCLQRLAGALNHRYRCCFLRGQRGMSDRAVNPLAKSTAMVQFPSHVASHRAIDDGLAGWSFYLLFVSRLVGLRRIDHAEVSRGDEGPHIGKHAFPAVIGCAFSTLYVPLLRISYFPLSWKVVRTLPTSPHWHPTCFTPMSAQNFLRRSKGWSIATFTSANTALDFVWRCVAYTIVDVDVLQRSGLREESRNAP